MIDLISAGLKFLFKLENFSEIDPIILCVFILLLLTFIIFGINISFIVGLVLMFSIFLFRYIKLICCKNRHKKIKNNCTIGRSILEKLVVTRWPYGTDMYQHDEGNCRISELLEKAAEDWMENSIKSLTTTQTYDFERLPDGKIATDKKSIVYYEKSCKQKFDYLEGILSELKSKIDNYKIFSFS